MSTKTAEHCRDKEMPNGVEPHITFIKLPNSDYYQYAGVFAENSLGHYYYGIWAITAD